MKFILQVILNNHFFIFFLISHLGILHKPIKNIFWVSQIIF